jgi:hypothetical protein
MRPIDKQPHQHAECPAGRVRKLRLALNAKTRRELILPSFSGIERHYWAGTVRC